MSCYHPLKAFSVGVNHETGKQILKVRPYTVDYIYKRIGDSQWHDGSGVPNKIHTYVYISDFIEIPCGKCIGCRLKYSRDWANRCMLESYEHDSNLFLTLTYNDEQLPPRRKYFDGDGVEDFSPVHPLRKRDMQLFMKRLRRKFPEQRIRFFGCGEYGSKNMRPHYHLILFGLKLDDLQPISKSSLGYQYFTSESIYDCWYNEENKRSNGFHIITACTWDTCAYTARYVTKKHKGIDSDIYDKYNYEPEFVLMSRKPGIARDYYERNKDKIFENEEIHLSLPEGCRTIRPPAYYDRLFDLDYPDLVDSRHEMRRKIAEDHNKLKSNLTSLEYLDRLEVEEYALEQRTKILGERNLKQ